jgi:hypothetical protein
VIGRGCVPCESDDLVALAKQNQSWADLAEYNLTPVIDDEEITKALGG